MLQHACTLEGRTAVALRAVPAFASTEATLQSLLQGAAITTITRAHLSDDHSVATLEVTLEEVPLACNQMISEIRVPLIRCISQGMGVPSVCCASVLQR